MRSPATSHHASLPCRCQPLRSSRLAAVRSWQFGKLSLLRFLNASHNNISGTLPPALGSLPHLNELHAFENSISGTLPLQLGKLSALRSLRLQDNALSGNFTQFSTLGNLRQLVMLDLYNNQMIGEVPPSVQNLSSLQYLYLDNEHYKPLRQKYCRQRIPNNGKYSYTIVREQYQVTAARRLGLTPACPPAAHGAPPRCRSSLPLLPATTPPHRSPLPLPSHRSSPPLLPTAPPHRSSPPLSAGDDVCYLRGHARHRFRFQFSPGERRVRELST